MINGTLSGRSSYDETLWMPFLYVIAMCFCINAARSGCGGSVNPYARPQARSGACRVLDLKIPRPCLSPFVIPLYHFSTYGFARQTVVFFSLSGCSHLAKKISTRIVWQANRKMPLLTCRKANKNKAGKGHGGNDSIWAQPSDRVSALYRLDGQRNRQASRIYHEIAWRGHNKSRCNPSKASTALPQTGGKQPASSLVWTFFSLSQALAKVKRFFLLERAGALP